MISYLVTLYNKAAFLPDVWAALRDQQGDFAREYIFVDDGSTDETLALLRALTAGRDDVVVLSQANAGPARALNAGLQRARGAYVKLMDGDDVLLPWATQWLLDAMGEAHAVVSWPELQWRYTPGAAPRWAEPPRPAPERLDLLPLALKRAHTMPSLWLVRRAALLACGGCDTGVFIQDYSLELRLAAHGLVALLRAPLVAFPEEAPGRLSDNQAQTLHDVNVAALRFLAAHELPRRLHRLTLERAVGRAYLWAARRGAPGLAPGLLWRRWLAMAGLLPSAWASEARLTAPFRATHPIRVP